MSLLFLKKNLFAIINDNDLNIRENSDTLVTSAAWKRQKAISAEEGLIALAYNPIGATKGTSFSKKKVFKIDF